MLVMPAVGRQRKCGSLGFAGQPSKPALYVSYRPVREPVSKVKVVSTWERFIHPPTHTYTHTHECTHEHMNTQRNRNPMGVSSQDTDKKILVPVSFLLVLFWHKDENLLASSSTPSPRASLECYAVKGLEILPQVNQLPPPQQTSTLSY